MKHSALAAGLAVWCSAQQGDASAAPRGYDPDDHLRKNGHGWDNRTAVTPRLAALAAIDSMNTAWYNETDGRWNSTTAWWLTGNALQAVADYMYATDDDRYLDMAENTITKQSAPLNWWPEGGGNFRADSTDDTGWWALALVRLYDITGNRTYLDIAEQDEAYIYSYWNSSCGGGVIWNIPSLSYKNAISNELYMKLAASLHNRIAGDTAYLAKAQTAWAWFRDSGLVNGDHLVNDGLTDDCANNGQPVWTYNQGVVLGALAELYRATDDDAYLDAAATIADAVVANDTLSPGGVLYEQACEPDAPCDNNQQAFKGIFMRNLGELNAVLDGAPYARYLKANADAVFNNDRNNGSLYGISWNGPYTAASVGTQSSAVSLFVANMWG